VFDAPGYQGSGAKNQAPSSGAALRSGKENFFKSERWGRRRFLKNKAAFISQASEIQQRL
jgi:hypothetical protein